MVGVRLLTNCPTGVLYQALWTRRRVDLGICFSIFLAVPRRVATACALDVPCVGLPPQSRC